MNILALTSLLIATLYSAVTPTSAHGYVSLPPSRQARCRNDHIPGCGPVRYEPQSVEAHHGSFLCNGGGQRFPELNDEYLWREHFFTVPLGSDHLPFTWTITASHRTTTFEYFLLSEHKEPIRLASFDYSNKTIPSIVTHDVPFHHHRGKHTILGRWNIGDTPNSFYSCVDLLIMGDRLFQSAKYRVNYDGGRYTDQASYNMESNYPDEDQDTCDCRAY